MRSPSSWDGEGTPHIPRGVSTEINSCPVRVQNRIIVIYIEAELILDYYVSGGIVERCFPCKNGGEVPFCPSDRPILSSGLRVDLSV